MNLTSIEHANITVPDIDVAFKFLKIIAPDFVIRKDQKRDGSYRWAHIGNDHFYIALQEPHLQKESTVGSTAYENSGVNHLALIVSDLDRIEKNLIAAGYEKSIDTPVEKFRKRIYYYDNEGFEWELVEYLSDDPSERYLYE